MDQKTRDVFMATAEGMADLARRGELATQEFRYDEAVHIYTLLNEMSYSVASALRAAVTNDLKKKVLPEDMLVVEQTGAENPLSSGQYL